MSLSKRSDFERCALAAGLLTREQLDEAIGALRWSVGEEPDDGSSTTAGQLADKLVDIGRLNPWQAKQLLEGRTKFTLGVYRIVDYLGQGGMGQVFRGVHGLLGREVAIKVLPRHKSTPEAVASFAQESRAQARLNHENLVQAFDAGHDGNVYYLVSEYVPGMDLRKLVHRAGPLGMQTAAGIISQVAKGLEHAHREGLIHRDVKPGNVLVKPDGRAKLSDLGLARPLEGDAQSGPRFGKIVGTADYLSPDHIAAPWAPTPAWDIYSLGCTLYYAATSKVPFPGGSTADKARAHCELRPLDPRRFNPRLSAEFVDVIADMMAKDPAERIQTAAEVVARLAPWVGQPEPIPLGQGNLVRAATSAVSPGEPLPGPDAGKLADTADSFPEIEEALPARRRSRRRGSQTTRAVISAEEETYAALKIKRPDPRPAEPMAIFRPLTVFVFFPLALVALVTLLWTFVELMM